MDELATATNKLVYFKEYRKEMMDDSSFKNIPSDVVMVTQSTLLDYTAVCIPTVTRGIKFDENLLIDPNDMRDCCKTALSLMNTTTNYPIRYDPYTGISKVIQLIKRIQELSEEGNYVVISN